MSTLVTCPHRRVGGTPGHLPGTEKALLHPLTSACQGQGMLATRNSAACADATSLRVASVSAGPQRPNLRTIDFADNMSSLSGRERREKMLAVEALGI